MPSRVYSIDIKICGTAYVKASSRKEAHKKLGSVFGLEVMDTGNSDIPISGAAYNSPNLPEVSISPAMTMLGAWNKRSGDIAEDLEP